MVTDAADALSRDHDEQLLKSAVAEAAGLLEADGAMLYLYDEAADELRFAYDAGVVNGEARGLLQQLRLPMGRGMYGTALERRELLFTDDYPADQSFSHYPTADRIVEAAGMRTMAAAPMFANDRPLGVLGAFSSRPQAFGQPQLALLRALADHAASAIANRQLLIELSRTVTAHRALDEIARRIVDVADAAEVLQQVVDTARELLGSDGAHLTLISEDRTALIPIVMAGVADESVRAWLHTQRFPVGGGINGLAALTRQPVWTEDYRADPRWPHDPDDDSPVRLGLGASVVAPLMGVGGEVLGTLAITYRERRPIDRRDVTLLEELARQASIAARNAQLYGELRHRTDALADSERRYRYLLDHSPDLVWEVDADGRMTYVGEVLERLTGYTANRVLNRYWVELLMPDSMSVAEAAWRQMRERPDEEQQFRVNVPLERGGTFAAEVKMIGKVENGRFAGGHGSLRDITERSRLEEDLRRRSAELAANEERATLARELHDSVTQALFSMGLTLSTVELLLDRDPVAARRKFAELRELQSDALAEMRALIFELRPRGLETDGLVQALRNHANAVSGRTGLAISVDSSVDGSLDRDTEQTLYRIAQEALHNVVKHANARSAHIRLQASETEVQLAVEDDGAGFDTSGVSGTKLGLIAMRQRAEQLGGRLEVHSREGRGTRVTATLPSRTTAPAPEEPVSA